MRAFEPQGHYILDGATGTELGRRGVNIGLPLWSANALLSRPSRQVLRRIHADYVDAGAEIITANTFRCHRRSLDKAGLGHRTAELVELAVELAGNAAAGQALVAGSIAPLEDCYRPDLVPSDDLLAAEHAETATHLAAAGCDLLLVETMNTVREAVFATRAARTTDLPVLVCFVCGADARLLSGEHLVAAVAAVLPLGPSAIGVNCTPAHRTAECLAEITGDLPRVAYANVGEARPDGTWHATGAVNPDDYAGYALSWTAQIIGGCCGTTPSHIRRLSEAIARAR